MTKAVCFIRRRPRNSLLPGNEEDGDDMPILVGKLPEDIPRLRAEGYGVDNDNEPVPENQPSTRTLRFNKKFKE